MTRKLKRFYQVVLECAIKLLPIFTAWLMSRLRS